VVVIFSGEQGLATQHLSQDTANGPNINGLGVLLESQHNLRGSVPAGCDVFSHETGVVFLRGGRASEAEIANLEVAIGIEEQVGWLEISVENVCGVHSLEGAEGLVDKVLAVVIRQILCANNTVHIGLHKLLDEIDFGEGLIAAGFLDVEDRYNVLMVEVSQQLHLTQGSKAEHGVIEGRNLLDSDFLTRRLVKSRADNTISTLSYNILNIVLLRDVEGDLTRSRRGIWRTGRHLGEDISRSLYLDDRASSFAMIAFVWLQSVLQTASANLQFEGEYRNFRFEKCAEFEVSSVSLSSSW